jgi:Protein of unknown function (DUF2505)
VRFQIEQRFTASTSGVLRALTSEHYLRDGMSKLPDISEPAITQHHSEGSIRNVLTFSFGGHLPSMVTSVVDPKKLSWIEDTTIELASFNATFTITPTHYAHFFGCIGSWKLTTNTAAGTGATRIIEGTMKVSSPISFVNGQVERAIVSALRERLAHEPAILDAWLLANPA